MSSPTFAISGAAPKLNQDSPLYAKAPEIAAIYDTSCNIALTDRWAQTFPIDTVDKLTDTFFNQSDGIPRYVVHSGIFSGFNLGLVLNYTDLTEDYKQELCKRYANLYMSGVVNSPENQQPLPALKNDLSDDIFKPRVKPAIKATPRIAEQTGCRYMYHVLALKPVIEFNALDATLEIMMNMMWSDYKADDIKAAYPFILQGAKFGRFLYTSGQKEELCYD